MITIIIIVQLSILFPDHQIARKGDFLNFSSLTRYKIVFCKAFLELFYKGRANASAFLIDRVQCIICPVPVIHRYPVIELIRSISRGST